MKISILGKGKMGQVVEHVLVQRGHQSSLLEDATVCIDFSHPDAVLDHVLLAAEGNKNLIMGTTGWEKDSADVKKIVESSGIGFLAAPNFSVGVLLFKQLVKQAAALLQDYDVSIVETHHRHKVDAPSGTARSLGEIVVAEHRGKERIVCGNDPRDETSLQITSVRSGENPGNHTVLFDTLQDTITLSHQSKGRESFALGAVLAAEWIEGKSGYFTIEDMQ